jgi:tripartite-type tricarboxylate transporter receptor subunit TctC
MQWNCRALSRALVFSLLSLFAGGILAQGYPSKPITFIAPFPAGSAAELLGRIIGSKLHERWGQPVVVEAKPGAGGTIGADFVAKSAPDGYTMLVGSSAETTVGVSLYRNIPYQTLRDLAPVIAIGPMPNVLVANPAAGIASIKDLVALAKSKPGELNFASSGNGTTSHLGMEMLKLQTGIDMIHIPHKGSQPAITDTLSGRTAIMWGPMGTLLPHVKAGKLRALAVSTDKRSPAAPDVPTLKESGYSDFEASLWWGILAPAQTPRDIVTKLNAEIGTIMQMPEVRASLVKLGVEPLGGSSEQYAALLKSEIAKWAHVIKQSGARVE